MRMYAIVVYGAMGTGKTTLAAALAQRLKAVHVSLDAHRQQAAAAMPLATDNQREQRAQRSAEAEAMKASCIVLDTTATSEWWRYMYRRLLLQGRTIVAIRLHCMPATSLRRCMNRSQYVPRPAWGGHDLSASIAYTAAPVPELRADADINTDYTEPDAALALALEACASFLPGL